MSDDDDKVALGEPGADATGTSLPPAPDTVGQTGGQGSSNSEESSVQSAGPESGSDVLEDDATHSPVAGSGPDKIAHDLGFHQLRYEFRCKICRLANDHSELYIKIHEMVLKDRVTYTAALNKINVIIDKEQLQIPPLNIVNVSSHFKKHIGADQRVALIMQQETQPAAVPPTVAPRVTKSINALIKQNLGNEVDDFKHLDELRSKLTEKLETLESQLNTVDPLTKQIKFDRWMLGIYKDLVGETRNCINDLNKMRQSERLIKTIVQQLLDRMTFAIIPQLLEEYAIIADELSHTGTPLEVVRSIDERLRTKTAQIVAQTARAAVVEIQRQFRLK